MTGRERLEQVREALAREWAEHEDPALAALDGCVVLTAEEAERVRGVCLDGRVWEEEYSATTADSDAALALLTPTERSTSP